MVLIAGTHQDIDIKAWFDPEQKFALREMSLTRTGTFEPGNIVSYSFFFDKYIKVKSVPLPTEKHWILTRIPVDTKVQVDDETAYFSDFSISSNANPQPFTYVNKIPNGTPVYAEDAPQIEYIWLDGKIVPKTNEVMLAIARGGHKFMPGPESPRFWFLGISILLILMGGGIWVYKNFIRKDGGV